MSLSSVEEYESLAASAVAVGHIGDPNAAVLNLQTTLPQVFIYEGNTGPAEIRSY